MIEIEGNSIEIIVADDDDEDDAVVVDDVVVEDDDDGDAGAARMGAAGRPAASRSTDENHGTLGGDR